MRFDEYLEFTLFKRRKLSVITDGELAGKLQKAEFPTVPDEVVWMLDDTPSSYYRELNLHSGRKPFYKALKDERYTHEHLPALSSLLTHFALSLQKRMDSRSDVDVSVFKRIRASINDVIDRILAEGAADSAPIRPYL